MPWYYSKAFAEECDSLLVHGYRLLLVAALDVPEHNVRESVAVLCVLSLGVLEVCKTCVSYAPVELHVRDDVEGRRHLLLRDAVLHRGSEDEIEYSLDVCVRDLVERRDVSESVGKSLALDLDELRGVRKLDEVVVEDALVSLSKVEAE